MHREVASLLEQDARQRLKAMASRTMGMSRIYSFSMCRVIGFIHLSNLNFTKKKKIHTFHILTDIFVCNFSFDSSVWLLSFLTSMSYSMTFVITNYVCDCIFVVCICKWITNKCPVEGKQKGKQKLEFWISIWFISQIKDSSYRIGQNAVT